MEQLVIHGGNPLRGRVKIGGAKNAVLPIIAAALLGSRGVTVLEDVPALDMCSPSIAWGSRRI